MPLGARTLPQRQLPRQDQGVQAQPVAGQLHATADALGAQQGEVKPAIVKGTGATALNKTGLQPELRYAVQCRHTLLPSAIPEGSTRLLPLCATSTVVVPPPELQRARTNSSMRLRATCAVA